MPSSEPGHPGFCIWLNSEDPSMLLHDFLVSILRNLPFHFEKFTIAITTTQQMPFTGSFIHLFFVQQIFMKSLSVPRSVLTH